jgi:hypothetical protein
VLGQLTYGLPADLLADRGQKFIGEEIAGIRTENAKVDRGSPLPGKSRHSGASVDSASSVGNESFTATTDTAIHTRPNIRHEMINTGPETLQLLFVWWAPGGDNAVLDLPSRMLDGWHRPQAAKR